VNRFAPTALMLGNVVTGCSVLAPAGMLGELSSGLDVSIRTAGLLITFGAVVLCVGSPVTAWLTSRIERRTLLTATIAVLALGNFASAIAPDYASLLAIRLVILAVGALYTPQAAGSVRVATDVGLRCGLHGHGCESLDRSAHDDAGRSVKPFVGGLGRLNKSHPSERRVIFDQLDASLQLKHPDSAQARFAACGFHQFSTDTSALQGRADG
jgi:hypothetical protein